MIIKKAKNAEFELSDGLIVAKSLKKIDIQTFKQHKGKRVKA